MPRSIWNGTISFGMVRVPVKLYSATEQVRVHLREVHLPDAAPIRHRRFCEAEDREVPYEEVVKGYELPDGRHVVLDRDEVRAAAGDRGKVVELEEFISADEVDPVAIDRTYYVGTRDDQQAYDVFKAALERQNVAGVGRFSFHNREYLAAIRAYGPGIALHTLRFHDEIVEPEDLNLPAPKRKPAEKELKLARRLIDSLAGDFDITEYEDTYRDALLEMIEAKAEGKKTKKRKPPKKETSGDLEEALEASLA